MHFRKPFPTTRCFRTVHGSGSRLAMDQAMGSADTATLITSCHWHVVGRVQSHMGDSEMTPSAEGVC